MTGILDKFMRFIYILWFYMSSPIPFQYITRQLETVRDSSESRMRIYEELDRTSQELEKTNQRLHIDSKTDKQRIEKWVHWRKIYLFLLIDFTVKNA